MHQKQKQENQKEKESHPQPSRHTRADCVSRLSGQHVAITTSRHS